MVIQTELADTKAETLKSLEDLLEWESDPYYTQNVSNWRSETNAWLIRYRNAYLNPRKYEISRQTIMENDYAYEGLHSTSSLEQLAIQALSRAGFHGVAVEDLARLSVPNPVLEELTLMAKVMAFYEVAYNVSSLLYEYRRTAF